MVGLSSTDIVLWKPNNLEGRMPKIRHRAWSSGDGRGHLSYVIASLGAKCWLVKWARPLAGMEERERESSEEDSQAISAVASILQKNLFRSHTSCTKQYEGPV